MMSKRLRILVDARPLVDLRGGGVRRVTEQTCKSLFDSGAEAEWYLVTTGLKKSRLPEWVSVYSNVHHLHLAWANKLWSIASMFGAISLDREAAKLLPANEDQPKRFDRVIIPNLGFTGFLETPYALLLHDLSFIINPKWFCFKSRLWHIAVNPKELIRRADTLFAVSETTARDATRIFKIPLKEIKIVKPGMQEREEAEPLKEEPSSLASHFSPLASSSPYALVLGSGDPRKNVPTTIKAFEILRADPLYSDLRLVVVGGKRKRGARNEGREIDSYIPSPSDTELDHLYQHASVFLYPSWYEGYGLPLHEAARFGTPCIASTDGALPETAPEGTILVPPSKPHLWTEAIRNILSHPNRYRTSFDKQLEQPDFNELIHWLK